MGASRAPSSAGSLGLLGAAAAPGSSPACTAGALPAPARSARCTSRRLLSAAGAAPAAAPPAACAARPPCEPAGRPCACAPARRSTGAVGRSAHLAGRPACRQARRRQAPHLSSFSLSAVFSFERMEGSLLPSVCWHTQVAYRRSTARRGGGEHRAWAASTKAPCTACCPEGRVARQAGQTALLARPHAHPGSARRACPAPATGGTAATPGAAPPPAAPRAPAPGSLLRPAREVHGSVSSRCTLALARRDRPTAGPAAPAART